MRTTHRAGRTALSLVTGAALAATGALPAAAAAPSTAGEPTTWTLVDYHQHICSEVAYGRGGYFLVSITGRWTSSISVALTGLPTGATTLPTADIPPGSNYNNVVQTATQFQFPPAPAGDYPATLSASDGAQTQSVTVTVQARDDC